MSERATDEPLEMGGKRFTNVEDYVRGLVAAVRTHRKLNDDRELEVEIDPSGDLPLVQRILLR